MSFTNKTENLNIDDQMIDCKTIHRIKIQYIKIQAHYFFLVMY